MIKMVKQKRAINSVQRANLARGRRILAQKMGANMNPRPQIIREIVRQPVVNQTTTHQHNINVQLSLFNRLLETKLFTLEVNKNKERLNFYEVINRIYSQLNNHQTKIITNENNITRIIDFINSKSKEDSERFQKIEQKIAELEQENKKLKEKLTELQKDD